VAASKGSVSTANRLALIAAGYVLSVACGLAAVAINEAFMPTEIAEGSGGMVAFGDMVLFVLVAGVLSFIPTWFLLRLAIEKAPRALLGVELVIAAAGPASWLAVLYLANDASPTNVPEATREVLGLFITFGAMPRIIFGPVLLVVEGATFFLSRERVTRALLGLAMLMNLVPLSLFVLHMARATLDARDHDAS
jgi:hypothetical protein